MKQKIASTDTLSADRNQLSLNSTQPETFKGGSDTWKFPPAMTLAFKVDLKEILIEVPLDRERNFMILNNPMLLQNGKQTLTRKLFEVINGKKLKPVLTQRFLIKEIHPEPSIKPQLLPVGTDILNSIRARIIDRLDHKALAKEEQGMIDDLEKEKAS